MCSYSPQLGQSLLQLCCCLSQTSIRATTSLETGPAHVLSATNKPVDSNTNVLNFTYMHTYSFAFLSLNITLDNTENAEHAHNRQISLPSSTLQTSSLKYLDVIYYLDQQMHNILTVMSIS